MISQITGTLLAKELDHVELMTAGGLGYQLTIPLGVFSLQSAYETEWQLVAAASFIGLVPMMAAFVFLQRYFIAGLTAGAVKG